MERFNKKIYSGYFLIFFKTALIIILSVFSFFTTEADDNAFSDISMRQFTSPEYNEATNKLEYIVTGKNADSVGAFIKITDVKVEMISEDGKHVKSIITTPEAFYNRALQLIKGDKPIHYRSMEADADGIGFDGSLKTQLFHIKKDVKMIIRSTESLQGEDNELQSPQNKSSTETISKNDIKTEKTADKDQASPKTENNSNSTSDNKN